MQFYLENQGISCDAYHYKYLYKFIYIFINKKYLYKFIFINTHFINKRANKIGVLVLGN